MPGSKGLSSRKSFLLKLQARTASLLGSMN
jgi:hypothetical protein